MSTADQAMFGKYRLLGRISEGGMGVVYRAQHTMLGHEAAIKILPLTLASDENSRQWFARGAASAARLAHPNILPVWEYGEEDGHLYLAMPLIRGGMLKERMLHGPVVPARIVGYLRQIAAALDFAHEHGIVHRDVKPQNILIEAIDGEEHLFLADFGIAKALEGATALTRTGSSVGTPEYMAPEQAQGRADQRSDLYALGIILYQLLTGKVPYSGSTAIEVLMKHLTEPLPQEPLRQVRPSLPDGVARVLQRALAKNPDERYQSGQALVDGFVAALNERGATTQVAAMPPPALDLTEVQAFRSEYQSTPMPRQATPQPTTALVTTQVAVPSPRPTPVPTPPPTAGATPHPQASVPNGAPRRNPLVIGLVATLAVALVACLGVGSVGAYILRPTPVPSTRQIALIEPTATPLPPTATPVPPTATALPATPTPAPSPTPRPSPSPTPRPSPSPTLGISSPIGLPPGGAATYRGTAQYPFAMYYPEDWTTEVSNELGGVYFRAPDNRTWLFISTRPAAADANINGLRDEYKRGLNSSCIRGTRCARVVDDDTGNDTVAGTTFAFQTLLVQYKDGSADGLRAGQALKFGYIWQYEFLAPADSMNNAVPYYLVPMLESLNIYARPTTR